MSIDAIEPFPGQELTDAIRAAVTVEERFVPGPPGSPEVRVSLYRQKGVDSTLPLIVSLHGGGFGLRADNFPAGHARLAMLGALVVAVDYRIVPEHPFPDGVEDCFAALCWAVDELDIDPSRVVVTGPSAGGALTAAVTQMARDRGGPPICFQGLVIPVIDDRCETPSMRQFVEAPLFGSRLARSMWDTYLGTADLGPPHRPMPPLVALRISPTSLRRSSRWPVSTRSVTRGSNMVCVCWRQGSPSGCTAPRNSTTG